LEGEWFAPACVHRHPFTADGALVQAIPQGICLDSQRSNLPCIFGLLIFWVDPLPGQFKAVYDDPLRLPGVRLLLADIG
jgi:hypothetical protein